jgi:hypothetical protein
LAQRLQVLWFGSLQVSLNAQRTVPHACAFVQQVLVSMLTHVWSGWSQQAAPQTAPRLQHVCVLGLHN